MAAPTVSRFGSRFKRNVDELREFLANAYVTFLPVSLVTADRHALIAAALRKKGKPIPVNDIWIAAQALESGADLVSNDQHVEYLDGVAHLCAILKADRGGHHEAASETGQAPRNHDPGAVRLPP